MFTNKNDYDILHTCKTESLRKGTTMNLKNKLFVSFLLLSLSIILVACGETEKTSTKNEEQTAEKEVLELYTTIFPLEDFAKKIGGEYVNVTNLVPVGADAHTFEPTARDMMNVADGDAFIYNGAGLEGFVDALLETIEREQVKVVEASAGIDLLKLDEEHHHEEGTVDNHEGEANERHHDHDEDPHIWLDPILSISLAESIKDALIELMPEQAETFTANFEQLKADLEELDQEFRTVVDEAALDTFFVSHAGYGYWEERYGVQQVGISGISPTNEPSQRQLQTIIEIAKENNIQYILFEQNIPTKVAEVVKKAIDAESVDIHNLEALVEDDVKNNEDYISLMKKNIEALKIALN